MAHVFVSYDRDDRDFAEVVQAKLERAGHQTSMDFDILSAGDDWQDKLDAAIRSSDAIVVIMGPEARASDYVAYEWAFALGAGVKVIPLELRTTPFPPRLDGLHRLDFTQKKRPWDTLLAEVARVEASRRAAVTAAGDPDTPPPVQQALRGIDSLLADERLAAVNTLAQTDHPAALDGLTRALEHPVKDVRMAAARVFPDRANPRIVPALIDDYRSRLAAWFARSMPGDPPDASLLYESAAGSGAAAVPELTGVLKRFATEPRDFHLRRVTIRALGRTGSASALPPLQQALTGDDQSLRCEAAQALGELGEPRGAAALRTALTDSDESVRWQAADSLGRLKDASAVPALIDCLADDTSLVRTSAARALGKIGERAAVPPLLTTLLDGNYALSDVAVEALGLLGDDAAVPHLRSLLPHESGELSSRDMSVMTALVRLRDAESFDRIGNLLVGFRTGNFGGDVYQELARYGDTGIEVLCRVLNSERRSPTQSEAAKALESVRKPDVVNALKTWRRKQS
jgi:HEAT repeat protein